MHAEQSNTVYQNGGGFLIVLVEKCFDGIHSCQFAESLCITFTGGFRLLQRFLPILVGHQKGGNLPVVGQVMRPCHPHFLCACQKSVCSPITNLKTVCVCVCVLCWVCVCVCTWMGTWLGNGDGGGHMRLYVWVHLSVYMHVMHVLCTWMHKCVCVCVCVGVCVCVCVCVHACAWVCCKKHECECVSQVHANMFACIWDQRCISACMPVHVCKCRGLHDQPCAGGSVVSCPPLKVELAAVWDTITCDFDGNGCTSAKTKTKIVKHHLSQNEALCFYDKTNFSSPWNVQLSRDWYTAATLLFIWTPRDWYDTATLFFIWTPRDQCATATILLICTQASHIYPTSMLSNMQPCSSVWIW